MCKIDFKQFNFAGFLFLKQVDLFTMLYKLTSYNSKITKFPSSNVYGACFLLNASRSEMYF